MKPMNDPAKAAYFEPARYASKLAAMISEHQSKDERPDWWQQVVAQLHSQLDKQFPPFYDCEECGAALYAAFATCEECGHKFNQGADVIPPESATSDPVSAMLSDSDLHPAMRAMLETATGAPWRSQSPPWKPQAVHSDHEAAQHGLRILALEGQVSALGDWADLHYMPNEAGDYVAHNCIHDLITEGTADAVAGMQEQIDRLTARIDTIGDVLIKALQSIDALESKTPC